MYWRADNPHDSRDRAAKSVNQENVEFDYAGTLTRTEHPGDTL